MIHVFDVGRAAKYVCDRMYEHHGGHVECVIVKTPYGSCSNKHEMILNFERIRHYENVITACVTCMSVLQDWSIPNSVIPVCRKIKKYANIIILSTSVSARIRLHEQILGRYIRYIMMDDLLHCVEKRKQLRQPLNRLSTFKHLFKQADCIVLGCSHFCMCEDSIKEKLKECGFSGNLINGVDELVKNIGKSVP